MTNCFNQRNERKISMQFIITIVVGDAEDVFEVAKLLEPISKLEELRMVSVVHRPTGLIHQPLAEGETVGKLPGAPMGAPGQSRMAPGGPVQFSPPAPGPDKPAAPSG